MPCTGGPMDDNSHMLAAANNTAFNKIKAERDLATRLLCETCTNYVHGKVAVSQETLEWYEEHCETDKKRKMKATKELQALATQLGYNIDKAKLSDLLT